MIENAIVPAMADAPLVRFCGTRGLNGYEQSTREFREIVAELQNLGNIAAGHGEIEGISPGGYSRWPRS
jgi:hypothetical protein